MLCKICGREFKTGLSLAHHIRQTHAGCKNYYDTYIRKENEGVCKVCGDPTRFINMSLGYRIYCSARCANIDPAIKAKRENTYFQKTGFIHNMNNPDSVARLKKTNNEKYGADHYFGSADGKEKVQRIIDTKTDEEKRSRVLHIQMTTEARYGVKNVFQAAGIKEKIKRKLIVEYGVDNPMKSRSVVDRAKKTMSSSIKFTVDRIQNIKNTNDLKFSTRLSAALPVGYVLVNYDRAKNHTLRCPVGHEFIIQEQMIRIRKHENAELCNVCNPYATYHQSQNEIYEFLKGNYSGVILKNDRKESGRLELDVFLPDLKLAFEFNGIFWHKESYVGKKYHLDKTEHFESKGVRVIHIYEDDWNYKRDIIKSKILNLIGKTRNKIYARKSDLRELSYAECERFLIDNHIQGNVAAKMRIGLFYDNELVSVMSFGYARMEKLNAGEFELLRFCTKIGTSVVGGASKLFKYFVDTYQPTKIISYADRSWSSTLKATVYDRLGFVLVKKTEPNYFYIINTKKESRFSYRKSKLIKLGFSENKTESEIMTGRGIDRIYDSGNLKYEWVSGAGKFFQLF